jgi:8-oxo-dGTP pyrophosphatase MutT (NUDIX family)
VARLRKAIFKALGWPFVVVGRMLARLLKPPFAKLGTTAFKLTLPIWRLYLKGTKRTRLVVLHDGKLLLVRIWLSDGTWMLPGGGLHRKEDPVAAALRELKEETRIVSFADKLQLLGELEHTKHKLKYTYICYGLVLDTLPRIRHGWPEIIEHRWASAEDLQTLPLSEEAARALDWLQN